jgi:hypothetical protein
MLFITRMKVEGEKKEKKVSWNFKKAKWKEFQKETETDFMVSKKTNEHREYEEICNTILKAAKKNIPRGQVKNISHSGIKN